VPAEVVFVHTRGDDEFERVIRTGVPAGGPCRTPGRLCVVPEGAPLFDDRSMLDNVRLLSRLFGRPLSRHDAEFALRSTDVPDRLHQASARSLPPLSRLQVWLAIARLEHIDAVVLERPFTNLATDEGEILASLLRELAQLPKRVVVSGPDQSTGELLRPASAVATAPR